VIAQVVPIRLAVLRAHWSFGVNRQKQGVQNSLFRSSQKGQRPRHRQLGTGYLSMQIGRSGLIASGLI